MDLNPLEQLAADFAGWRIECSAQGTGFYSAHRGEDEHVISRTLPGLRRLLEQKAGSQTFGELMTELARPGF
jgi:hypothetical protein